MFLYAVLEFDELEGEFPMRAEEFAQLHERAHNLDACLNSYGTIQDAGEHYGAMLCEGVWTMAAAATPCF